ncbi:putative NAD(P)-binding protein [Melghirimyces profundicolus]|uniref:Putative NAD(P)-binding protein n=1 Tax=Melghirimyces profundicolus TaxID=1242148 RepID=A0A2T6C0G2_9BACL|nr:SDR family oxidoreductase [Melghirimyces profundicolus]PTX61791.1 putative NAD(P)-binding protein [Melghirimyces profundicolus]
MKVVVIGANGKIGRHLVQLLSQRDHQVRAVIRDDAQKPKMEELGADEVVVADLEKKIDHAVAGCDAIVFTAGSGSHTGADKTMLVDLDGAFKTIDAGVAHGVERFLMVSSMMADRPEQGTERIRHYFVAKGRADERLRDSGLNYTIVRPGRLTDEPAKGTVSIQENHETFGEIPRADVAATIVESLQSENTYRRSFDLLTGDVPIEEALKTL